MSRITNSIKKTFQDKIVQHQFQLDEFGFKDLAINTYEIRSKKHNFWCQLTLSDSIPSKPFHLTYLDIDSVKAKSWSGTLDGTLQIFDAWLKNIMEDRTQLPYELRPEKRDYSIIITTISPKFPIIYNQALRAEKESLDEICGMGYRKAFEFLLKDYLIRLGKMTLEEAQAQFRLKECIDHLKDDELIHKLAAYTANLGNDFSHYYRKMVDKEVENLKELINILVTWIDTKEGHKIQIELLNAKSKDILSTFENKSE